MDNQALSQKVIGCAMAVHRELGPGFLESVYRNALAYELRKQGLPVEMERRLTVRYRDVVVGNFVVDMIVDEILVVELKANSALTKVDEVQTVNYLTATHQAFGLLINFGASSLEFRRKYAIGIHPENPVNPV